MGGSGPPHFCSDPSWDLRKSVEKCFMYRGGGGVPCMHIVTFYCSPATKNCSDPPTFFGLATPLLAPLSSCSHFCRVCWNIRLLLLLLFYYYYYLIAEFSYFYNHVGNQKFVMMTQLASLWIVVLISSRLLLLLTLKEPHEYSPQELLK